jgi:hypothetical protein
MNVQSNSCLLITSLSVLFAVAGCMRNAPSRVLPQQTEPTQGVKNMILYEVSPVRSDYMCGEEVQIRVEITNNGATPLEIPDASMAAASQPTHWLTGPGYPERVPFTNHMRLTADAGPSVASGQNLMTIPPGGRWTDLFALDAVVDVSQPGEYHLGSKLEWSQVNVQSKEHSFTIHNAQHQSIGVGQGVRPFQSSEGEGAFIQQSGDARQLYAFSFREMRPSIGEARLEKPIHRCAVGPTATDVAVPWRNTPFFDELIQWIVWREDQTVKMLANNSERPLSLDIPGGLSGFVHPPLKTFGNPVEVLGLSQGMKEVSLITFPHPSPDGETLSARIEWQMRFPEKPSEIIAALAQPSLNNVRHIAFAVQRTQGIAVFHASYGEGGKPTAFESVELVTGKMLVNAPLAMFVDGEGIAHVSVLLVTDEQKHSCAVAEARFDRDGKPFPKMIVTALGALPGMLEGGAQIYVDKEGKIERHEVVIAVEGHRLFHLSKSGEMVPVSVAGNPTNPMLLVPGKQASYILYFDSSRGLYFEPI